LVRESKESGRTESWYQERSQIHPSEVGAAVRTRAMQSENGAQVGRSNEKRRATKPSERGDKKAENSKLNTAGFKESSNKSTKLRRRVLKRGK